MIVFVFDNGCLGKPIEIFLCLDNREDQARVMVVDERLKNVDDVVTDGSVNFLRTKIMESLTIVTKDESLGGEANSTRSELDLKNLNLAGTPFAEAEIHLLNTTEEKFG